MHRNAPLTFALVFVLLTAVMASAAEYTVMPGGGNEVKFVSKAVGETFDGTTDQISGSFTVDPDDLSAPVSGSLEIPVRSLDTGIKLRNEHMFKNHLHPDEYPTMEFTLTGLKDAPAALPVGEATELTGVGTFTCHGETNPLEPMLTVTRNDNGSLSVHADWTITLDDYNIERPQFLIVKLAETQDVSATFTALPK